MESTFWKINENEKSIKRIDQAECAEDGGGEREREVGGRDRGAGCHLATG